MSCNDMTVGVSAFQRLIDGQSARGPQATILIVADEWAKCMALEDHLAAEDYVTLCVQSVKDMVEAIATCAPDLVLLDAMMPAIDGYAIRCISMGTSRVSRQSPSDRR